MLLLDGCSFISFKGIRFDTARGNAIRSAGTTEEILVENCTVRNIGGAAININSTKNTVVRNNHVYDIGFTGISVGGGDYARLISGNNLIENNHIHKVAQIEKSYQTAVTLGYRTVGTTLRNNEIHDTPHAGIIIYGPEHIVEYNNIYDVVKEFLDMDAIYLNVSVYPWERGVIIRNNYFHDFGQLTLLERQINIAGVRTDNNGCGLSVIGNVFHNIGYKDSNQVRAVCAEGTYNKITGNIFVDCAEAYDGPNTFTSDAKFDLEANQNWKTAHSEYQQFSAVYGEKYPEILDFWDKHFTSVPKTNIYSGNLVVNIKFPISTLNPGYDLSGYRAAAEHVLAENNYVTDKDPGFLDYSGNNFNLKTDSVAFERIKDFTPVDFSKIGIPKDEIVGYNK